MRRQRGSLAVEFAILVPALVLLFGLIVGGARTWLARTGVQHMAGAAARAASLERSTDAAEQAANRLAAQQALASGMRCQPLSVQLDAPTLSQQAGTPGRVTATVDCQVPMSDIVVPGWPGTVMVSASAQAVVDTYRGRTP
ncbi:MAG TPA: pilus assembly protein TadE [Propionibacteriaceae bacterium]|nr:pilus assembly protein TadE [Propionibacteriaceae bacterium]